MSEPHVVGGPAAWRGPELQQRDDWIVSLDDEGIGELTDALERVERAGTAMQDITLDAFPLPTLGPRLVGLVDELTDGRGFFLLRGFPVKSLTERQCELMYWGLGQYIGIPLPQNNAGEYLVHVRDQGLKYGEALVRGYQTNARLDYHVDSSDVVALLCRHPAKRGGVSTIVSSTAIHDHIVQTRPDLARVLESPFWFDRKKSNGPESFYQSPVFSVFNGRLAARYGRSYIESSQRGEHVPPLSEAQIEALDLVDELTNSPEFVLNMDFQQGDIQFLLNYSILHARTDYEDWPEPERKRDLIRLWLTLRKDIELAPDFAQGGITPRAAAFS